MTPALHEVPKPMADIYLPLPPGAKDPPPTGWASDPPPPMHFGPDDNHAKRLDNDVDIDLDCEEVRFAGPRFLPRTRRAHGRPSVGVTHYWYKAEGASYEAFTDVVKVLNEKGKLAFPMLIEIRTGRGHYTVIPQSRVPIKGSTTLETLRWYDDGEPSVYEFDSLRTSVVYTAITALLARRYAPDGARWEFYQALAGFLLGELKIPKPIAQGIIETAAEIVGDEDTSPTPAYQVQHTEARLRAGELCIGSTKVAELIGEHGPAVVKAIRKWCGTADDDSGIVVRGGDLSSIVDRAETALLATPIYQRGGLLTRAIKLDTAIGEHNDIRREAGSTVLIAVREPWLVEQMGLTSKWLKMVKVTGKEKTKGSDDEYKPAPIDPPPLYARTLLGRAEWRFPVLRGVVTAPTLARDGRIIETPGFDKASGLLVDIGPGLFAPIPVSPTLDEAIAALAKLAAPLRKFPFVDDAARSVALSALLTALIRVSLRTAPLHAYDAPTAGTGKSLLAEMAGLLATGFKPPALSQGKSDEEDEKRLSTVLFAGDPVIHIDNCERAISGDFLCSMLTQEVVQARILGLSERRVLPSTALVLATGNNLTLAGDTTRRAVICRLDAQVERPDTREFDFDCHAEVLANRPELVVAGLTILRAYDVAGRPQKLTPMGSFNDWEWIRGALVWLGRADPADTRSSILDSDPRKDELISVMEQWSQVFAAEHVTVGHIATRDKRQKPEDPATPADALRARLTEVACKGSWNAKSIGWWLRRNKDSVVGGRCFRCEPGEGRAWWLESQGVRGNTQLDLNEEPQF